MPEITSRQFADEYFYPQLKNKDLKFNAYRKFTAELMQQYPNGIPDDVLAQKVYETFPTFKESGYTIKAGGTAGPPTAGGGGYWDALRRGYHAGSEALDTAYANVAGLGATALEALPHIPGDPRVTRENDPLRQGEAYLRGLAQREGARAKAIPESRGIGPSIAEAVPTAAG